MIFGVLGPEPHLPPLADPLQVVVFLPPDMAQRTYSSSFPWSRLQLCVVHNPQSMDPVADRIPWSWWAISKQPSPQLHVSLGSWAPEDIFVLCSPWFPRPQWVHGPG